MYTVERYHDISCGHRVHGHESKCAFLHGHNYRITFTCAASNEPKPAQRKFFGQPEQPQVGELDAIGRVIDFSDIKSTLCEFLEQEWDHKFLLWQEDPLTEVFDTYAKDSLVLVPFNPTAENMAQYLVDVIGPRLLAGTGVQLVACKVEETRKCSATYRAGA